MDSYIDRIKGAFKLTNFINLNVEKEEVKEETTESTSKKKLTPKEKATKENKPWFTVIEVEIDPDNPPLIIIFSSFGSTAILEK